MSKGIHLVGFGSQGTAWGQNLRDSGWQVHVYLAKAESASFERAARLGFEPKLISDLPLLLKADAAESALVAMLTPDHVIGPIYGDMIARVERPLTLVLAHGYAVYANELRPARPGHEIALLAPKAIGPKLRQFFSARHPETHHLVAGFSAPAGRETQCLALARGLGFAPENLVHATFEKEAIGDLISEQALLCGGVFTLLEYTMQAMRDAGVPDGLIREECLTELELIAGLVREKGPAAAFSAISQAAQCGTVAMRERLERAGLRELITSQASDVVSKRFVEYMRDSAWRERASQITKELKTWEARLERKPGDKKS